MKNLILTIDTINQVASDCEEYLKQPCALQYFVYGPEDSYVRKNNFGGLTGGSIFKNKPIKEQLNHLLSKWGAEFVIVVDTISPPYSLAWPDPASHPQIFKIQERIIAARETTVNRSEENEGMETAINISRQAGIPCTVIDSLIPAWDPREQTGDFDPDEIA